jgi:hypothetical protein
MLDIPLDGAFGLPGGGDRTRGLSNDDRLPLGGGLKARSVVGSTCFRSVSDMQQLRAGFVPTSWYGAKFIICSTVQALAGRAGVQWQ